MTEDGVDVKLHLGGARVDAIVAEIVCTQTENDEGPRRDNSTVKCTYGNLTRHDGGDAVR